MALVCFGVEPVRASSWGFGSHFGLSTLMTDRREEGTSTVLAMPSNTLTYQPALRVSVGDRIRRHEVAVDAGVFLINEAGTVLSLLTAVVGYQHTFLADRRLAPFANVGVGLLREDGSLRASTRASMGGGVGIRHRVGDDNGALRAEIRADHLGGDGITGRPALTTLGLRLGFDLWL